jgi:hypothetical protein
VFGAERCPLCPGSSDLNFLGDLKGIVYLDAKIPHGAFNLRMAEQVGGSAIDQCRLPAGRGTPAAELVSVMGVSFVQRPPACASDRISRNSLLTDHTCHDMVTRVGCSGRNVTLNGLSSTPLVA